MRFRIGINYWPSESAMFWWQRFDPKAVWRHFERIRRAGFDHVRIFALWEDFQPEPELIAPAALRDLVRVADMAAEHELSLIVTLFTGHMSGANWIPRWALAPGDPKGRFPVITRGEVVQAEILNWYTDEDVQGAQAILAGEIAAALGDHPSLWAWDLGNEPSNCVVPPSRKAGTAWLERIKGAIRAAGSSRPITLGLHMEDLEEDRRLGPSEAARVCDFLSVHAYPVYASWARSPTDEAVLPFLGLITHWLGGKDVLLEEFGAPTCPVEPGVAREVVPTASVPLLDEQDAADYTIRALEMLHRCEFLGASLWCYGDYGRGLWDGPPLDRATHERFFGLWHADGTPKPAVESVAAFAARPRSALREDDLGWIDLPRERFYDDPATNLKRLYERFQTFVASSLDETPDDLSQG